MKILYLPLLIILVVVSAAAQVQSPCILQGELKGSFQPPTISVTASFRDTTALTFVTKTVDVIDGKFSFSGFISYPHAVHLWYEDDSNYLSTNIFFINAGTQSVQVHTDGPLYQTPVVSGSASHHDFLRLFKPDSIEYLIRVLDTSVANLPKSASAVTLRNLYRDFYRTRDNTLVVGTAHDSDQFISAWLILRYMHSAGYSAVYDEVFETLDSRVKNSSLGVYLKSKLETARKFSIGSLFAPIELLDVNLKPQLLELRRQKSNTKAYTLIDYWFSSCGPCIAQFSEIKVLQTKYSDKLRVIGISVDGNEKIPAWRSIIKSKQLTWKQYLDMGGLLAKQMGINSYPSNFLVDANGVIVARNLEVEEIESFLAE